jgi:hypothetical protein
MTVSPSRAELAEELERLRQTLERLEAAASKRCIVKLKTLREQYFLGQPVVVTAAVCGENNDLPLVEVPVTFVATWGKLQAVGGQSSRHGNTLTTRTDSNGTADVILLPQTAEVLSREQQNALETALQYLDDQAATPDETVTGFEKIVQQYQWDAEKQLIQAVDIYFKEFSRNLLETVNFSDHMFAWSYFDTTVTAYIFEGDKDTANALTVKGVGALNLLLKDWLGPWLQTYLESARTESLQQEVLEAKEWGEGNADVILDGIYDRIGSYLNKQQGVAGRYVGQKVIQNTMRQFLQSGIDDLPLISQVELFPGVAVAAGSPSISGADTAVAATRQSQVSFDRFRTRLDNKAEQLLQGVQDSLSNEGDRILTNFKEAAGNARTEELTGFKGEMGTARTEGLTGFKGEMGTARTEELTSFRGKMGTARTEELTGFKGDIGTARTKDLTDFKGDMGTARTEELTGFKGEMDTARTEELTGFKGEIGTARTEELTGFKGEMGTSRTEELTGFKGDIGTARAGELTKFQGDITTHKKSELADFQSSAQTTSNQKLNQFSENINSARSAALDSANVDLQKAKDLTTNRFMDELNHTLTEQFETTVKDELSNKVNLETFDQTLAGKVSNATFTNVTNRKLDKTAFSSFSDDVNKDISALQTTFVQTTRDVNTLKTTSSKATKDITTLQTKSNNLSKDVVRLDGSVTLIDKKTTTLQTDLGKTGRIVTPISPLKLK